MMNNSERQSLNDNSAPHSHKKKSFKSNVELHPSITPGIFINNYIEELQEDITRLSEENYKLQEENVYLQSDEYLDTIFPTNYIQQLKDEIQSLKQQNEQALIENVNLTTEKNQKSTFGSYTSTYVQELQDQLTKVTEENFYLKSSEYQSKITNSSTKTSNFEKQILQQKVNSLSQLVVKFSHDSIDREDILGQLKEILDR